MARPPLNVHQLELFYHVARHGGITAAARRMPYGIQQPAISTQIAALERSLDNTRLFHRRPFQLTPEGRRLYDFVRGFFDHIDTLADDIAGRTGSRLRLAAPATILRNHIPGLLIELRRKRPDLELFLHEANQHQCEELLARDAIDLAVCDVIGRSAAGLKSELLLEVPLALLLPPQAQQAPGADGPAPDLARLATDWPLVSMPPEETLSRRMQQGLAEHGLAWQPAIEATSTELVHSYVAGGLGIGLTVGVPGRQLPPGTRLLVLHDFPRLEIAALWRGKLTPLASEVLARVRQMSAALKQP